MSQQNQPKTSLNFFFLPYLIKNPKKNKISRPNLSTKSIFPHTNPYYPYYPTQHPQPTLPPRIKQPQQPIKFNLQLPSFARQSPENNNKLNNNMNSINNMNNNNFQNANLFHSTQKEQIPPIKNNFPNRSIYLSKSPNLPNPNTPTFYQKMNQQNQTNQFNQQIQFNQNQSNSKFLQTSYIKVEDQIESKKQEFPPELKNYASRAFLSCTSEEEKNWMQATLKSIISKSTERGDLWKVDWTKKKLPKFPQKNKKM